MKRLSQLAKFSILLTAAAAPLARGQSAVPDSSRPEIVTSAIGEATLVPDRAAVYVGVQTRAATAAAAARDNATRQRAVIEAIAAVGVPRDQISTESYSVAPDGRFDPTTQKTTITGYVVSNVVRVELRRIDQVAAVLDAALAKGANQINSLDFFASNADSARHGALLQAISRARADAEVMANAAGGTLGSLLELSTNSEGPRPVYRMQVNAGLAASATPIEPGQQRVQASVSARWRFVARK
jgi:hypothetical protein